MESEVPNAKNEVFRGTFYGFFGWLEAKWFAGEREVISSTINRVVVEKWSEEEQRGTAFVALVFGSVSAHCPGT